MTKKLTINEFKQIAASRSGKCLSDHYTNNHTHLKWECEFGHIWSASSKAVKKGTWCPTCYNQTENRKKVKRQPHKLKEVQNKAKEMGGICLSSEYVNNNSLMRFRCAENHEWETTWRSINKGAWCIHCSKYTATAENKNRIENEAKEIAKLRGGKLLSKYIKSKEKLKWECALGHTWKATFHNVVKNNSWCPKCASNLSERICRYTLEELFEKSFSKIRFPWLRNEKGNTMELDGFNLDLNLGFEHHGAQHYRITHDFVKNQTELNQRQKDDNLKEKLCLENGIYLIIIPELFKQTDPNNLKDFIINEIKQNTTIHIPFENKKIDVNYFYNKDLCLQASLKEIKEIVNLKEGRCLDEIYIHCNHPMNFVCKFNHQWITTATRIKQGSWCHTCANKTSKTIKDAKDLARECGGFCLSEEYIDSQTTMTWKCGSCDNIWKTSYNAIQSGTWCPPCSIKKRSNKKRLSIEEYQKIAKARGGKLISTTYNSCYDNLIWQCKNKHVFAKRADQVKNNNKWCSVCKKEGL